MALSILQLPDSLILRIFSYLKSYHLFQVSGVCTTFEKISKDRSLWNCADLCDGCLTIREVSKIVKEFFLPTTLTVRIRGKLRKNIGTSKWKISLLSEHLMSEIAKKCPNLIEFYITEAAVDAATFKMKNFREIQTIKKLRIIDCEFYNLPYPLSQGSYFKKSNTTLPNLELLEISGCNWVDDYDIMVLSKFESIKVLILKNDIKIGVSMVYLAMSFRFGFKGIEEIDLRGTSLKTHDVKSIVQCGTLKGLYLGPIGKVKRVNDNSICGMSLVMPDPRYAEDPPQQQVVVLNIGPNGPSWRQVNDDELNVMGLAWVRNSQQKHRERNPAEDEDGHYFVGQDGRPLEHNEGEVVEQRRKDEYEDKENESDNEDDLNCSHNDEHHKIENNYKHKKRKRMIEESDEDNSPNKKMCIIEENKPGPSHQYVDKKPKNNSPEKPNRTNVSLPQSSPEIQDPDGELTDSMVDAFGSCTEHLEVLVLRGCAITDKGFRGILNNIPTLKYLDVRNTYVTHAAIVEAQEYRPSLTILGNNDNSNSRMIQIPSHSLL